MCYKYQTWTPTAKGQDENHHDRNEMLEENTKCNKKGPTWKHHLQNKSWSKTSTTLHPEIASKMVWPCLTTTTNQNTIQNIHTKNCMREPMQEIEGVNYRNLKYPII